MMRVFFKKKVHDYPKMSGDYYLAWYNQGKICILKKKPVFVCKAQHVKIKTVNRISQRLWAELSHKFKNDMALYARQYKITYPGLRKRGISAYSIFLKITHGLIRRFSLEALSESLLTDTLKDLLYGLSVHRCVQIKLLNRVPGVYQLNHPPYQIPEEYRLSFNQFQHNLQSERALNPPSASLNCKLSPPFASWKRLCYNVSQSGRLLYGKQLACQKRITFASW